MCNLSPQAIDFVDWVFNSSAVLRERANLMDQYEGLTHERDPERRGPFIQGLSKFGKGLTDDVSTAMVKKFQNRQGLVVWPWERIHKR